MDHIGDVVSDEFIDGAGQFVPAAMWNYLCEIIDAQVSGALTACGTGIITGGAVAAGSGLAVNVQALSAIVITSVGPVFIALPSGVSIPGLTDNAIQYLFAGANIVSGGGADDSRNTGVVVFRAGATSTPYSGETPLAKVITAGGAVTSVTDLRVFLPASALALIQAALTEVEAALGTDYFPVPGTLAMTVTDRLTALEATGVGGSGALYADPMQRSAGNVQTVGQEFTALEARLTTVEGEVGSTGGGTVVVPVEAWDVSAQNQGTALLARLKNGTLAEALAEAYSQVDAIICVAGVFGDASNGSPQFIDVAHSTW
jgi:hypothetical protein